MLEFTTPHGPVTIAASAIVAIAPGQADIHGASTCHVHTSGYTFLVQGEASAITSRVLSALEPTAPKPAREAATSERVGLSLTAQNRCGASIDEAIAKLRDMRRLLDQTSRAVQTAHTVINLEADGAARGAAAAERCNIAEALAEVQPIERAGGPALYKLLVGPRARSVILAALRGAAPSSILRSFQARNAAWMAEAFADDPTDLPERVARFGEEALELQQALGQSREDAHALVDYVFDRPAGEPSQEMGGVKTTLALLAAVAGLDMEECGERELARCSTPAVLAKIRGKRAGRAGRGALPGVERVIDPAREHEAKAATDRLGITLGQCDYPRL